MYRAKAFYPLTQALLHHLPQHEFYVVGDSGLRSIAHQYIVSLLTYLFRPQ